MQQQKTFAWARKRAWRWIWEGIRLRIRFRLHMPDEVRALFTSQTACIVLHSFCCCCCCCIINATAKRRVGSRSSVQTMQIRRVHPSTPSHTIVWPRQHMPGNFYNMRACSKIGYVSHGVCLAFSCKFSPTLWWGCSADCVCVYVCVPQMSIIYKMPAGTFAPYPKTYFNASGCW